MFTLQCLFCVYPFELKQRNEAINCRLHLIDRYCCWRDSKSGKVHKCKKSKCQTLRHTFSCIGAVVTGYQPGCRELVTRVPPIVTTLQSVCLLNHQGWRQISLILSKGAVNKNGWETLHRREVKQSRVGLRKTKANKRWKYDKTLSNKFEKKYWILVNYVKTK